MKNKIIIWDTETTGFLKAKTAPIEEQPHMIQFAGRKYDFDMKPCGELFLYFKQEKKLPSQIVALTKITDAILNQHKPLSEEIDKITDFFEDCKYSITHNHSFDKGIIDVNYQKLGKEFNWNDINIICTVQSTYNLNGFRLSQDKLFKYLFDKERVGQHNAINDINDLCIIVKELLRRNIIKIKEVNVSSL